MGNVYPKIELLISQFINRDRVQELVHVIGMLCIMAPMSTATCKYGCMGIVPGVSCVGVSAADIHDIAQLAIPQKPVRTYFGYFVPRGLPTSVKWHSTRALMSV
jgi:hypothetical protein